MVETTALVSYDPEEMELIKVARKNAAAIFTPEFIPYYPAIQKQYELSPLETLIYGFIRFYLGTGQTKEFFFTNIQLSAVLGCSEGGISNSMKVLRDKKLINCTYKRTQTGTFRKVSLFVKNGVRTTSFDYSHSIKRLTSTPSNDVPNKNIKREYKKDTVLLRTGSHEDVGFQPIGKILKNSFLAYKKNAD